MTRNKHLERFGFRFARSSTHNARTMMFKELDALFEHTGDCETSREDYRNAIVDENCLAKRSGKTRVLTYQHLVDLYGLDPSLLLFRALCFFWKRDIPGRPLLALITAVTRDPLLRASIPFVRDIQADEIIVRQHLEQFIDDLEPDRFSKATLTSTAQNINATWTQSGHLKGRVRKIRTQAQATPGSVSLALLLGYLAGHRGPALFETEYISLLDCPVNTAIELAEEASRRGWIVFKRVGDVMEVLFPRIITSEEMEWIHEQN
jgi:hypothetical protein